MHQVCGDESHGLVGNIENVLGARVEYHPNQEFESVNCIALTTLYGFVSFGIRRDGTGVDWRAAEPTTLESWYCQLGEEPDSAST